MKGERLLEILKYNVGLTFGYNKFISNFYCKFPLKSLLESVTIDSENYADYEIRHFTRHLMSPTLADCHCIGDGRYLVAY